MPPIIIIAKTVRINPQIHLHLLLVSQIEKVFLYRNWDCVTVGFLLSIVLFEERDWLIGTLWWGFLLLLIGWAIFGGGGATLLGARGGGRTGWEGM